jgi:hypothetical protein
LGKQWVEAAALVVRPELLNLCLGWATFILDNLDSLDKMPVVMHRH